MFNLNDSMRYYLSPYPTDIRKSFYIQGGVTKDLMGQDVRYGIQALLAERDRLFQKNSLLRSKLKNKMDKESPKSSCEDTINHQQQRFSPIRLPIFSVVYEESPTNALSRKSLSSTGWILMI